MSELPDIIYTKVDEAPELASGSFLPIIQSFTQVADLNVGTKDISLAGRIISQFPDRLTKEQQQPDDLALLGEIVLKPDANIIKLPNISASIPQIQAAVKELQDPGLQHSGLSGRSQDRRGKRYQSPLRQSQGKRGQPRLATGKLGSPGGCFGQKLRQEQSAQNG